MKKYLIILLVIGLMIFTGCTESNYNIKESDTLKTLNHVEYPVSDFQTISIPTEFRNVMNIFTSKTCKEIFDKNQNYVYSPISLYMCFSMLTEGANGETLTELLNFHGLDTLEELREQMGAIYSNNYYENKNGKTRMSNSIWIKNNYSVKEEYTNILAQKYFAECFNIDFTDSVNKQEVINWINNNTFDFLDLDLNKFPISNELVILLLNTIYFNNKWKDEFDKDLTQEDIFKTLNGEVTTPFMTHEVNSLYYKTKEYQYIEDYFYNGNKISYILPNEGINPITLLTDEIFTDVNTKVMSVSANITLPKFKYISDYDLTDNIKALGVNKIFTSPDFSKITDNSIFVSFVKQTAGIELNEEGVEAAAVTGIGMVESVGPQEPISIKLDRPFIYIIRDSNSIPLFVGIVQNPKQ